jgi:hypothetical protein
MHPGHETLMYYFSCLGGPGAVPIKSASGHVISNQTCIFLHPVGSTGDAEKRGRSMIESSLDFVKCPLI